MEKLFIWYKKGDDEIYIPSLSSGLNILLTFKFITDIEYVSYTKVKEVLKDIYIKSNKNHVIYIQNYI